MERKNRINNQLYEELKELWYESSAHPVSILRQENALRNPWIEKIIEQKKGRASEVLDIGCGGGFLTNYLSRLGYRVTGVDVSQSSLEIAKKYDTTGSAVYIKADALSLPFQEKKFDVVCAMDLLEHVENPKGIIREAARVLKPGGLFFFHTFNRNFLSYVLVIKAMEWFVPNTPDNLHVYPLFIKPKELREYCSESGLNAIEFIGCRPKLGISQAIRFLLQKKPLEFTFCRSLLTGYSGFAVNSVLSK